MRRLPKYTKDEFARLGDDIYRERVHPNLGDEDKGKFVAIDVETGNYHVAEDELTAIDQLISQLPDAQVWMARVGFRHAHRFGTRLYRTGE